MNKNNNNSTKYINPNDPSGKQILKYMHHVCSEALDYCQKNGVESFEDFAKVVEIKSKDYRNKLGDKALISAKTNQNGMILQLKNYPDFGIVSGKKIQEHLGNDNELSKFTKQGIEKSLSKVTSKSQADLDFSFDDLLSVVLRNRDLASLDPVTNDNANNKQPPTNFEFSSPNSSLDDLDELDFSIKEGEIKNNDFEFEANTFNDNEIPSKNNDELDSFFQDDDEISIEESAKYTPRSTKSGKKAMEAGSGIRNLTEEVDGTTFIGIGFEIAGLTQILAANYLNAKDREEVEKTLDRLLEIQERYNKIEEKTNQVNERIQEDANKSNLKKKQNQIDSIAEENPTKSKQGARTNTEFNSDPTENFKVGLTKATNKLISNVNNSLDRNEAIEPVTIDKNTNFNQQLKQINQALDRLEDKLSLLEARIEKIEEQLARREIAAKIKAEDFAESLLTLEKLTPNYQKRYEADDRLRSISFSLKDSMPGLRATILEDPDRDDSAVVVRDRNDNVLFIANKTSNSWTIDTNSIGKQSIELEDYVAQIQGDLKKYNSKVEASANELQSNVATLLYEAHKKATLSGKELNFGDRYRVITYKDEKERNIISLQKKQETDSKILEPIFIATATKDGWLVQNDRLSDKQKETITKHFKDREIKADKTQKQTPSKNQSKDTQL